MVSTQSPIGASVPRPAENGLGRPDVGGRLVGLVRMAASEPQTADMVRELLTRAIWAPAAARSRLRRPELVANLIATQILGLVMARYVVRTEPLASLPTGPAADAFAPALQLLLSGRYWSE
jgi:Tetracyclin repressor-like, C-terminal domain